MFQITLWDDNKAYEYQITQDRCTLGKGSDNEIVLSGWRIAKRCAEIRRQSDGLHIVDVGGQNNIRVNNEHISSYGPLLPTDQIGIGTHRLMIKDAVHRIMEQVPLAEDRRGHRIVASGVGGASTVATMATLTGTSDASLPGPVRSTDEFFWQKTIHDLLLVTIDLRRTDFSRLSDQELRSETEALILELVDHMEGIPQAIDRAKLVNDVLYEAVGLGPLEKLLADDSISEVMVNTADEIFVERNGRLERHPVRFTSNAAVHKIIERIVAPIGRRIDESMPLVDARLRDGSRVNAIIPPLALKGPCITIRKFMKKRLQVDDLVRFGTLSQEMVRFLEVCVAYRKNIVISGGTGSGKTTLLNVLSNLIPEGERIVTIEDAAELQLNHEHLVTLESRPPNLEGRGAITIRDLVKNALRMRPDRIVVGECRGGEALDMLQAMNTGHDGSLTTAHANTPRDLLARLETMVLMAGIDLPILAIREQIAAAVDIVVQQSRFCCGSRKVTHITEVIGVEAGKIQLQDVYVYRQSGFNKDGVVQGFFTGCGFIPSFYEELSRIGIAVDLHLFETAETP